MGFLVFCKKLIFILPVLMVFVSSGIAYQSAGNITNKSVKEKKSFMETPLKISQITFSKDNKSLAVLAGDSLVSVWDTRDCKLLAKSIFEKTPITTLAWNLESDELLAGTNHSILMRLCALDLSCQEKVATPLEVISHVVNFGRPYQFGVIGAFHNIASAMRPSLFFANGVEHELMEIHPGDSSFTSLQQTGSGFFAVTSRGDLYELNHLLEHGSKPFISLDRPVGVIKAGGGKIALGCDGGLICLINQNDSLEVKNLMISNKPIRSLELTKDGKTLFVALGNEKIQVIDVETMQPRTQLVSVQEMISCMALSEDGKTLAVGTSQGSVVLWNLEDSQVKTILPAGSHSHSN